MQIGEEDEAIITMKEKSIMAPQEASLFKSETLESVYDIQEELGR